MSEQAESREVRAFYCHADERIVPEFYPKLCPECGLPSLERRCENCDYNRFLPKSEETYCEDCLEPSVEITALATPLMPDNPESSKAWVTLTPLRDEHGEAFPTEEERRAEAQRLRQERDEQERELRERTESLVIEVPASKLDPGMVLANLFKGSLDRFRPGTRILSVGTLPDGRVLLVTEEYQNGSLENVSVRDADEAMPTLSEESIPHREHPGFRHASVEETDLIMLGGSAGASAFVAHKEHVPGTDLPAVLNLGVRRGNHFSVAYAGSEAETTRRVARLLQEGARRLADLLGVELEERKPRLLEDEVYRWSTTHDAQLVLVEPTERERDFLLPALEVIEGLGERSFGRATFTDPHDLHANAVLLEQMAERLV